MVNGIFQRIIQEHRDQDLAAQVVCRKSARGCGRKGFNTMATNHVKPRPELDTSRFLSYVLRHKPGKAGVQMDGAGWVDVRSLLAGMNAAGYPIHFEDLEGIVRRDEKQRYSFSVDKTRIRANQGHSIPSVNAGLRRKTPPEVLYHGTAGRNLHLIMRKGLLPMRRNQVHLSSDRETAERVGRRHVAKYPGDKTVVLIVRAGQMHRDGHAFYISENGVWLADKVPPKYLEPEDRAW